MTSIEVPDWVVDAAVEAFLSNTGQTHKVTDLQRNLTRECMTPALTAALGAWVVPEKFQVRTRCPFFGWGHWYSIKSQQERDDHFNRMNMGDWIAERRDLYDLRQEKPE
jgi:hypothetical protein